MYELALLIENPHVLNNFKVEFWKFLNITLDISEFGRRFHIFAYKVHEKYISLNREPNRRREYILNPFKISKFLFGPFSDHLPGVGGTVPPPEPELTTDIPVPVLEHENRSLINLDSVLFLGHIINGVVDVGLLACGQAAVDLVDGLVVEVFKQDLSCPLVEDLLDCCALCLVFVLLLFYQLFCLHCWYFIAYFLHVYLSVQFCELLLRDCLCRCLRISLIQHLLLLTLIIACAEF